jgi:prephenate dehydrogenase
MTAHDTRPANVAVIGLGIIGGSVARGLAARGVRVLGYDSNPSHVDAAVSEGVVTQRLSPGLEDIGEADVIVIAVYGDSSIDVLSQIERNTTAAQLITDVGSTKRSIVSAAENMALGPRFVGAHPFAGDHRSGWQASRADLFEDAIVYLCPTTRAEPKTIALAERFWISLGAKPTMIDAVAHDDLLAWSSHLPHVVSTSLALALAHAGIPRRLLGRGGRDVTRLAASSPEVWTSVTLDNATAIEAALAEVQHELEQFREALHGGDASALSQHFAKAREWSGPGDH